jgi:drug/metabolite transporter (DMT)-like permease
MKLLAVTALVMVAFAANSVLNRMAVGAGMIDAASFAMIRLLAGSAALAGLLALRGRRFGLKGSVAGVAGLLVYLFGFSLAYGKLDAGTGALLLFGTVQVVMFAGALYAGNQVPRRRFVGAGLALAGLVVLLAPQGSGSLAAFAAMAAAGVGWGIYSLAGRGAKDALAETAGNFVYALPVGAVAGFAFGAAPLDASGAGFALAVLSGAVTSGMGYALWYRILPGLGASRAAVAQLTVPMLAAAGGAVLIGEGVGLGFVLAAGLVLGGVALASR